MGDSRTPPGAVISPLLFNIALLDLPRALNEIPGIKHAIYADDVTIWTNTDSLGQMEDALQWAADTVERIGRTCRLRFSPTKSELLVFRQRGKHIPLNIQLS